MTNIQLLKNTAVGMTPRKKNIVADTGVHHAFKNKSDRFPSLSKFSAERLAESDFGIQVGHYALNVGKVDRRVDLIDERNPTPGQFMLAVLLPTTSRTRRGGHWTETACW
jgi:hypothetical protein